MDTLKTAAGDVKFARLDAVIDRAKLERLPYIVRIFLENALRHQGRGADETHIEALTRWPAGEAVEIPFFPARVVLQDFTGVPVVADLAAMRGAVARLGGDPRRVNPKVPVDLVIDHSVIVDSYGTPIAFARNVELEYERNRERYAFLRWAQRSFERFSVVPPGRGIVHQVNLEFLARVVQVADGVAFPDTLVGTDSHTTMIGGLGVLGWGVGGIEAEAAMVGEPVGLLTPIIVGMRLTGSLPEGATATDLVLRVTEILRLHGVVGKFVEFFGPGVAALAVPDRATISNMSPEYGATEGIFAVDEQTIAYLRQTGRGTTADLVERYTKEQGLWGSGEPVYSETLDLDLSTIEPSLAGPKRPQDRVSLPGLSKAFRDELTTLRTPHGGGGGSTATLEKKRVDVEGSELGDGSVVIAAITSCTNTSNPSVMVGAGLLARKAVERGLKVSPTVKTSLAPGSPVVSDYLNRSGLTEALEQIGFFTVGFGCTTCIGNSGPLNDPIAKAIDAEDLAVAAVLSGNRNFEGRIHPQVRLAFLASPPLVVAYALAGTVDIDLTTEPLGLDPDGKPVFLREVWPSDEEIAKTIEQATDPESYTSRIDDLFGGDEAWRSLPIPEGDLYEWDPSSTYITEPPFVADTTPASASLQDIKDARVLVMAGDSVTTDHISPAGSISPTSPAAAWLMAQGVPRNQLHSYGARRGHHEVMMRGTFANIRFRNRLVPGVEGGFTVHLPDAEQTTIFEASERYRAEGVPLVILAGKEYGAGSSRDWAAKGVALLGVRAVIAESYERIHRTNLVQMGVLPLEFPPGSNAESLGLTGREVIDITGVADPKPGRTFRVFAKREDGTRVEFEAVGRLDTPTDVRYFREGGILPAVVRELAKERRA